MSNYHQIRLCNKLPNSAFDGITESEAEQLRTVAGYSDSRILTVHDCETCELVGVGVFGLDDQNRVTLYYARTRAKRIAAQVLRGLWAASRFTGLEFRVHTEVPAVMAYMAGAAAFDVCTDGDGVQQVILGAR